MKKSCIFSIDVFSEKNIKGMTLCFREEKFAALMSTLYQPHISSKQYHEGINYRM